MSAEDALKIWQLLEHVGLPALLTIPTVWFLFAYARKEKRDASDAQCPPWLNAAKKTILDNMRENHAEIRSEIRDLKDEVTDAKELTRKRDDRQQRIETALFEIKGFLSHLRGRSE